MNNRVYLVNPKTSPVKVHLVQHGFEVIVGDGKLSDDLLRTCWALIPGKEPITEEILEKTPELRLIVKKGVGLDRIDIASCTRRGICVANTPFSNYISVAEHTIAILMAVAKQFYPISLAVRCDAPDAKCMYRYPPMELCGKILSIIGLGNIGLRVAQIASGLDMKVIGYARHPEKVHVPTYMELADSMDEAIAAGDFVSLHVSGVKENRHLIGEKEIELMKPNAILVNTTRGFIVDENALYHALAEHKIAGAALDVVAEEPIRGDNPLIKLENVMLTPHCGGYTTEANARGYMECADIIIDFAQGRYPKTAANKV